MLSCRISPFSALVLGSAAAGVADGGDTTGVDDATSDSDRDITCDGRDTSGVNKGTSGGIDRGITGGVGRNTTGDGRETTGDGDRW